MKTISLSEFEKALQSKNTHKKTLFVDVRMPTEYREEHIKGVKNIPLNTLLNQSNNFKKYDTIYFHCKAGARCTKAIKTLETDSQITGTLIRFEGGIDAWEEAKLPLEKTSVKVPIIRQVMITAGILILAGIAFHFLGHTQGLYLSAFVGGGLLFSGITGWCGMAALLEKMPWNKS